MSRIFPVDSPDSDPPGAHEISQRKGWEMIRAFKDSKPTMSMRAPGPVEWDSIAYHAAAVKRLLSQKGAKTIRIHKALNDAGEMTLVLSAADKNGRDLKGGGIVMLDAGTPCPPDCPDPDPGP